jgi:8-oxo-dGTP diphosphatase
MNTGIRPPLPSSGSEKQKQPLVHVVAGVMLDARGRVLLARRTEGRDLAGAWEFPGGKVDPGETPAQALARELEEELGIRVQAAEPLIAVPQQYRDKRILLDVYRVTRYAGKPRDREQQALAWSPHEKLCTYPMPPADRPVVAALTQPAHYLVTPDFDGADQRGFLAAIGRALESGIRRLQLRVPALGGAGLEALAREVKQRCDPLGAELLVNGDIALAARIGCGVHLRSTQLMELRERPLPSQLRVAASCHDAAELARAHDLGLDFAVLGPVARTPGHGERAPIGWRGFAQLREQVSLPIYGLGGLARSDMALARGHGAQGIAAIRGLWTG